MNLVKKKSIPSPHWKTVLRTWKVTINVVLTYSLRILEDEVMDSLIKALFGLFSEFWASLSYAVIFLLISETNQQTKQQLLWRIHTDKCIKRYWLSLINRAVWVKSIGRHHSTLATLVKLKINHPKHVQGCRGCTLLLCWLAVSLIPLCSVPLLDHKI